MSQNGILRRAAAQAFTGYTATQFDLKLKEGDLPPPIQLGLRTVGWVEDELRSWLQFKIAERDGSTPHKSWREFHAAKVAGT